MIQVHLVTRLSQAKYYSAHFLNVYVKVFVSVAYVNMFANLYRNVIKIQRYFEHIVQNSQKLIILIFRQHSPCSQPIRTFF